jgi:hypothetical protein
MDIMTFLAIRHFLVDVESVLVSVKGVFVATPADLLLFSLEQASGIAGMRTVAGCATATLLIQQVTVKGQNLPSYFLVATQAGFRTHPAPAVTLGTVFLIGFMKNVTH